MQVNRKEKGVKEMKKWLRVVFSCVLSLLLAVSVCSCGSIKNTKYDYTANELVIKERDTFAPCSFNEFLYQNEHTKQFFGIFLETSIRTAGFVVTVDGEEWSRVKQMMDELPVGSYDLVIETPEGAYITELVDGVRVNVPFEKKITIPVNVSTLATDKYADPNRS